MSDSNTIKQLRNEVQLLRDELAIMKRKYEDILYNLDTDNFSQRVVKQGKDMYTKIEQTAGEISLQAEKVGENTKNLTELSITAKEIESAVFEENEDGTKTSRITQTAEAIRSEVQSAIDGVNDDTDEKLKNYSTITQTAEAIRSQAYASADLSSAVAIADISEAIDPSKTYVISSLDENEDAIKTYYYYNTISKEWEEIKGGGIETVFEQTAQGFKLKGDVLVDGSCILTDSLTFDASNRPVQVEYSVNGTTNWHTTFVSGSDEFMRLKIGSQWSDAMKIVGRDGFDGADGDDGSDGSDATVTPEAVFNALTDHGANQGIFAAFVNKENQLYINAEFIATEIAKVAETLYIGESGSNNEKRIQFQSGALISTYADFTGNPPTGIKVSSSSFEMDMNPSNIWVGNTSLEEYVAQYAGSGGTGGYATFK